MPTKAPTLETLVAERAIERCLNLYCRGIDRCDPELLRAVYHDDAVDDHGGAFYGGPDDYIKWVIPHLKENFVSSMHTLHNVIIDVQGDTARVESYCLAHHVRVGHGEDLIMDVLGCRYIDRFENREGAGWRIAHRVVIRESRLRQPMLPEAEQPAGFAQPKRDRADLAYAVDLPQRRARETS